MYPPTLMTKDFIGHIDLTLMHVVKHFLGPFVPDFIVSGMPEQSDTDYDIPFKSKSFLFLKELLLKAGAATQGYDFIFADHFLAPFVKKFILRFRYKTF